MTVLDGTYIQSQQLHIHRYIYLHLLHYFFSLKYNSTCIHTSELMAVSEISESDLYTYCGLQPVFAISRSLQQ